MSSYRGHALSSAKSDLVKKNLNLGLLTPYPLLNVSITTYLFARHSRIADIHRITVTLLRTSSNDRPTTNTTQHHISSSLSFTTQASFTKLSQRLSQTTAVLYFLFIRSKTELGQRKRLHNWRTASFIFVARMQVQGSILRVGPRIPVERQQHRVQWNLPGEEEDNNELNNGNNNRELEEEEQPTEAYPELKLATLNIIDGRTNRLNAALRCMQQMNVDVGLLTETKFHNDMFTKGAEGYTVTGTITEGNAGGVALIHRTQKGWGLESTRTFGPNVIRTTLVSGQRRWHIIGVYIPPSEENGETLDLLTQAYESIHNPNWPVILLGDLNVDLQNPGGNHAAGAGRRLETAALMATWGMEPLRNHF